MRVVRLMHLRWLLFIAAGLCLNVAMASTIAVTSVLDSGAGTLRQAIVDAAAGDTITFSLPDNAQITLTSAQLTIDKNLSIVGPGANLLSVRRSAAPGTPTFRIFAVYGNLSTINVSLSGLTISNGSETTGAGIYSNIASLSLSKVAVVGNTSSAGGGGIYFSSGGIAPVLTVDSSTIADNFGADGAGIYTASTTNIKSSTLSGNITRGNNTNGGGILVVNSAIVTITSSTIVGNSAQLSGGGLATGGGQIKLRNTIVARNTAIGAPLPDLSGNVTSNGYNFIGNSKGGSIVATTGDQVGSEAAPIDPLLGPLQDNGGPTLTRAPLSGSPVIEAGHSSGLIADQRGLARPVDSSAIANAASGDGTDIGAYELQADVLPGCATINRVVTNNADTGTDTLRDLIAKNCAGAEITFAPGISAITLTTGELVIPRTLSISGPGAKLLTVQRSAAVATPNFRLFRTVANIKASISGMKITNGFTPISNGGGILNLGGLTLSGVSVSGNVAPGGNGGGIFNSGTLVLDASAVSGNSVNSTTVASSGGGIFNFGGSLTLNRTTLSGNTATGPGGNSDSGGGIFSNVGVVNLVSSTIVRNTGDIGGGIRGLNGAIVYARNSIIALNTSASGPDFNGPLTSQGFNIVGDVNGSSVSPAQLTDRLGASEAQIAIGPLQDNGGQTPTHALLAGSVAIDKGHSSGATRDQRGIARPFDVATISNAGDGADVGAFEFGAVGLDVDGNNSYDALTDGLLILRYLFGLSGNPLTAGAIGPSPSRPTPEAITAYLDGIRIALDVDGNAQSDALTDGLMILRYLFGIRGAALTTGAVGIGATRTGPEIEAYIQSLMP